MTISAIITDADSSQPVDLLVQIGIHHEVRRVIAISNVSKDLKNGDVFFEPIYRYLEESSKIEPQWEKIGILR